MLDATWTPDYKAECIKDLLREVEDKAIKCKKRKSKVRIKVDLVCKALAQHRQSIDIFVQGLPSVASLIWGSVRSISDVRSSQNPDLVEQAPQVRADPLQAILQDTEVSDFLSDSLARLIDTVSLCERVLLVNIESDDVIKRVTVVLSQVINFFTRAIDHFSNQNWSKPALGFGAQARH